MEEPVEEEPAEEPIVEEEPEEEPIEPAEEEIYEPEPVPDPIIYTRNGDDIIKIEKPEDGPVMLYIKGNDDSRHFSVKDYDANDNRTNLFVNTTSPYEGITLDSEGTTVLLEIKAQGSWTIESRSVRSARVIESPGSINGTGDEVLLVKGDSSSATIKGNPNARHFAVKGYNPNRNLMVNTTDAYEGTVRVARNTFLLEITAEDDWEILLE